MDSNKSWMTQMILVQAESLAKQISGMPTDVQAELRTAVTRKINPCIVDSINMALSIYDEDVKRSPYNAGCGLYENLKHLAM